MMERADEILRSRAAGKKLAAAVSGGADSMCLLHFLLSRDYLSSADLTVVHVQHHLRKTAERDAAFVRDFCAQNGVDFMRFDADVPRRRAATGRSVESEARQARIEVFTDLVSSGAVDCVLTAHHASDQAETVLMHLLRGSGLDGLCGMEILSPAGILRPFLTTEKSELSAYADEHGVPFMTDETNLDPSYNRNFVRQKILPLAESRWPGATANLARTAALLRADRQVLDSLVDESRIARGEGRAAVPIACAAGPLGARYVRRALDLIARLPGRTERNVSAALALCEKQNGARADLGGGVVALREYDRIAFYLGGEAAVSSEGGREEIPFAPGESRLLGQTVCVLPYDGPVKKGVCAFDLDKVPEGATLRRRRPGDLFTPYGGGRKKLKEYLIDRKIPVIFRDNLVCLCYNKTILAVVGVEISDQIKLTEETVRPYRIFLRGEADEGT